MKSKITVKRMAIVLFIFAAYLAGGRKDLELGVHAQATNAKGNWINNERTAANGLINACQVITALDNEYVANGYGAGLVNGDFVGANAGILATDMVTAEGNLMKVCTAALGTAASFPVSIVTGTNTTIFKVR